MSTCELENEIRELAYKKWISAGCPITSDEERNRFWLEAEQEIRRKLEETQKVPEKAEKTKKLSIKSVSKRKKK